MAAALEYVYRYAELSSVQPGKLGLVAALDAPAERYFTGQIVHPRRTADFLLAVTRVVGSRFHTPPAMLQRILTAADPVVTCHQDVIRFEGFSACGGAYARFDLGSSGFEGEVENPGTTNVDFGPRIRAALAGLGGCDALEMTVAKTGVAVRSEAGEVTERKVKLPVRWVKGFSDVGLYQWRMRLWAEISGARFRRFLMTLPVSAKGMWRVSAGDLRLSQRDSAGALAVGGIPRLRLLEPVARHAVSVRILSAGEEATAWELVNPDSRFVLVLSGDVWRGFSGDGQALAGLARGAPEREVTGLRAALRWQSRVVGASEEALAHCASAGLLGYDLAAGAWFHRELPYNVCTVERVNPRLAAAKELAGSGAVTLENDAAWVRSGGIEHRVIPGESPSCTCVWFSKHGARRGPCKHVLAVRMVRHGDTH